MSEIEIGVFLPTMQPSGAAEIDVVDAARHAEQLGFGSVWSVDQLVAGTGVPVLDSIVTLGAVAGATTRIDLGLGVLIVPLRPVAWIAKQVASLQQLSGGRLVLGVGVGGDRHDLSWQATGVPKRERGARTDAALAALPDLITGKPTALPDVAGQPVVQLAPGVDVPPIIVGGASEAALRRAARAGDGWLAMPVPPADAAVSVARLRGLADEHQRPVPEVIGSMMVAFDDDPALPSDDELTNVLSDPDGVYGIPREMVPSLLVKGGVDAVRRRLHGWAELGASRVVVTLVGGNWERQAESLASLSAVASPLSTD